MAPASFHLAARVTLGLGQIQVVPEASRVLVTHVSPVVWSQALQRAQGPPTLAWCQANGPCSHCACRSAVLESEAPKHVHQQLSPAPPIFEGGPSGSHVFLPGSGHLLPSITICQGALEISRVEVGRLQAEVEVLWEEARVARQERDKVVRAHNTLLHDRDTLFELWEVQAEEVEQLQAHLMQEVVGSSTGALGFAALLAQEVEELAQGLHQVGKSEPHQREWLLREVAGTWLEVLGWAQEHRLLLDGLSSGVSFVAEELAGHAVTLEVALGVGRLSRLMEAHQH
ncbi:hypothetical protein C0992_002363 [Termitomyces sp. T32_za158]|nr:hypothetical protein C0992_002363 [Termitomyces sp. T32_za158]